MEFALSMLFKEHAEARVDSAMSQAGAAALWLMSQYDLSGCRRLESKTVAEFPFTFLTLTMSLEAIFLSAFILISQNEETRVADRRNALDLQVNRLSEQENTKMLKMLEAIGAKLGVEFDDDPSLAVLKEATRPEQLAAQIDKAATPAHES